VSARYVIRAHPDALKLQDIANVTLLHGTVTVTVCEMGGAHMQLTVI